MDCVLDLNAVRKYSAHLMQFIQDEESPNKTSCFDSLFPCAMSLEDYMIRVSSYMDITHGCFVVAVYYLDSVCKTMDMMVTKKNMHRLFLTSIMISRKILEDDVYKNGDVAAVGGVSLQEMNTLEMKMLKALDYKLQVSDVSLHQYCCLMGIPLA